MKNNILIDNNNSMQIILSETIKKRELEYLFTLN